MIFSRFAVKHPAIITILLLMLTVFGLIAGANMNAEMIPPTSLPGTTILTIYPGAGARQVEREVTRPIENQMATLAGLTDLSSSSSPSLSFVTLEFDEEVNLYERLPQIRELLNAISHELPDGIEGSPVIHLMEASSFMPVFSARLDSSMDPVELASYIEERISPDLARLPGVSRIDMVGDHREEVFVELDEHELKARGLGPLGILEILRVSNLDIPAGTTSFLARERDLNTSGSFTSIEELSSLVIGHSDGSRIYLEDVARVGRRTLEPDIRIRSDGQTALVLNVYKRDEGDTMQISSGIMRVLDRMQEETRGLVRYAVISDQSRMTGQSLRTVLTAGITGLVFTVLVIFLFLHNIRATLIIALSVPFSMLFAIMGLSVAGRSLNLISLSGLVVAIGMIVDNSIVILENTYRHYHRSKDRRGAALAGADELGPAILASTTTSICVFAPLMFLQGIIGIIMNDLSLAIVFALGASALVAVVLVPFFSSLMLKEDRPVGERRVAGRFISGLERGFARAVSAYSTLLSRALDHKRYVFLLSLSLLLASLLFLSVLKVSFLPATDTAEFDLFIRTPDGYTLERTRDKVDELEVRLREIVPEIEETLFYAGTANSLALTSSPNRAFGRVSLSGRRERQRSVQEIIAAVQQDLLTTVAGADVTVLNAGFDALLALGTGGQGFVLEIYGSDLDAVMDLSSRALGFLEEDPDVFKAELSVSADREQLVTRLNQAQMGLLGLSAREAGISSRILFEGVQAGTMYLDDRNLPLRLGSSLSRQAIDEDLLDRIVLQTRDGRSLSFAAFSTLELESAVSRITRRNRNYSVEVRGFLRGEDQSGVSARMMAAMGSLNLPPGVQYQMAGTSALIGDSITSLTLMLLLSLFLVYSVMVIQFERFRQPLVIMTAVPFCLIGVTLALLVFNSSLSIIAMLALITLGGTVVNNAIVLVDSANQIRRSEGLDVRQAVLEAAARRFRPILMTAVTTILGVTPMALAVGNGSEVYAPMGQAIIGGMLTSTLITLIIIPLLYHTLEGKSSPGMMSKEQVSEI